MMSLSYVHHHRRRLLQITMATIFLLPPFLLSLLPSLPFSCPPLSPAIASGVRPPNEFWCVLSAACTKLSTLSDTFYALFITCSEVERRRRDVAVKLGSLCCCKNSSVSNAPGASPHKCLAVGAIAPWSRHL